MADLTAGQVWAELEKELFAVLGMVTPAQESRTVGIVYIVRDGKLYISSGKEAWKVRHIAANPNVSLTVPIAKRIPFMPWIKIPAATITFQGTAVVREPDELAPDLLAKLLGSTGVEDAALATVAVIEVTPEGEFVTYGVGVSLSDMRDPDKARGRAPVA